MIRWRRRHGDRGSVSVEVAVLAPAFLALVVVAGVVGRTAVANEAIGFAAHDAARAASISRDADAAQQAAQEAAQAQLAAQGLSCESAPELEFGGYVEGVEAGFDEAFGSPPGVDASVSVVVTCSVTFVSLQMPGYLQVPDSKLVSVRFVSPLDRYRARSE